MVILERINKILFILFSYFQKQQLSIGEMIVLAQYLDPKLVMFTQEVDRDKAIKELTTLLCKTGYVKDEPGFYQAVIDREKIVSTGIGMGVAIPHAKLESCHRFFIAIGIHKVKGIEWKSLDSLPVQLIFLVGGPTDQQKKYLKILSQLTGMIKYGGLREEIMKKTDPDQIIGLFKTYEH